MPLLFCLSQVLSFPAGGGPGAAATAFTNLRLINRRSCKALSGHAPARLNWKYALGQAGNGGCPKTVAAAPAPPQMSSRKTSEPHIPDCLCSNVFPDMTLLFRSSKVLTFPANGGYCLMRGRSPSDGTVSCPNASFPILRAPSLLNSALLCDCRPWQPLLISHSF